METALVMPKKKSKLARQWDPHLLYMLSVQDPVSPTLDLMKRVYRDTRPKSEGKPKKPTLLREDFCGTALLSYEWIRDHKSHRAIGIDLDPDPLGWAAKYFMPQMTTAQNGRMQLLQQDVLDRIPEKADIACAYNFSYMIWRTRPELCAYFRHVHQTIADDGVFFLDLFGGGEAMSQHDEATEQDIEAEDCDSALLAHILGNRRAEFDYVWDQRSFNPVDHDIRCRITFEFPDGSKQKAAFRYHWRLWTIPELRELLVEAGFRETRVYAETYDKDGDFDGYAQQERIPDDPCWIIYLAAVA